MNDLTGSTWVVTHHIGPHVSYDFYVTFNSDQSLTVTPENPIPGVTFYGCWIVDDGGLTMSIASPNSDTRFSQSVTGYLQTADNGNGISGIASGTNKASQQATFISWDAVPKT